MSLGYLFEANTLYQKCLVDVGGSRCRQVEMLNTIAINRKDDTRTTFHELRTTALGIGDRLVMTPVNGGKKPNQVKRKRMVWTNSQAKRRLVSSQ